MSYHDTMSGKMTSHNSASGKRPSKKKAGRKAKVSSSRSQRIPTPAMKRTKGRY